MMSCYSCNNFSRRIMPIMLNLLSTPRILSITLLQPPWIVIIIKLITMVVVSFSLMSLNVGLLFIPTLTQQTHITTTCAWMRVSSSLERVLLLMLLSTTLIPIMSISLTCLMELLVHHFAIIIMGFTTRTTWSCSWGIKIVLRKEGDGYGRVWFVILSFCISNYKKNILHLGCFCSWLFILWWTLE